jgi:hypothetical protein
VLDSPFLADSDLDHGFKGTLGFSLLFHREHVERVTKLIPELEPHLQKVLKPETNVLFLNPLVIQEGKGVPAHADKTLASFTRERTPYPFCVSVLYLGIPPDCRGGHLVFHRLWGSRAVTPSEGMLVEFPGWLLHEVTPFQASGSGQPRVSLVIEQYAVKPELKAQLPEWFLDSCRPFEDFMQMAGAAEEEDEHLKQTSSSGFSSPRHERL